LGHAILIAIAVLVRPAEGLAVAAAAIVVVAAARSGRRGLVVVAGGAAAAAVAQLGLESVLGDGSGDLQILVEVAITGSAFLLVDLALGRRHLAQVGPLYITLLCAAALLAVAFRQSPVLSLIAAVPLLVTRYSFGRFSQARRTYAQTTMALSLLPEVAGLTPLGHGERTAVYAAALAGELGFDALTIDRVTTAARLHHIGHISLHEPEERNGPLDTTEISRVSGELLRETGFLADVAGLVEQALLGGRAVRSLEAATIRVCSTLDDLADPEGDQGPDDPFAAVLAHHGEGLERTAAIALLRLHDRRPAIVEEARAASRILSLVAARAGADGHDGHHDPDAHDCR
ncbi:MAG: hypothetical protein M3Q68_09325, partial [Actinomycetota bacterium]|nr:hypothetical protein [Actinomycetota bacterium]